MASANHDDEEPEETGDLEQPTDPRPGPAPHIPQILPIRLRRASTTSLGCTLFIGIVLTGMATLAWFSGHTMTREKNGWLLYVFCGGFGFFGLLVLWSWLSQILMANIPAPLLEISEQPFRSGQTARVALIQRGPAKLRSLRANLVCLEQHITWTDRSSSEDGPSSSRNVNEKMIHTQNLISVPFVVATAGSTWHTIEEFTIPADARASEETSSHAIIWRIELWGRGPFFGGYMRPFDVQVVARE